MANCLPTTNTTPSPYMYVASALIKAPSGKSYKLVQGVEYTADKKAAQNAFLEQIASEYTGYAVVDTVLSPLFTPPNSPPPQCGGGSIWI